MVLRITRDGDPSTRATLRLEGRIEGASTALLERECAHLRDVFGALAVDLSGVIVVDRSGVDVLKRLHLAGVEIRECSDLIASILEGEGIPVHRGATGTEDVGV